VTRAGALDARAAALTLLALVAFASNSLLTRLALGSRQLDAASFTALRLGSGAVMLAAIVLVQGRSWRALGGSGLAGPIALFAYAAPFSFAYLRIGAAVGALVLFGVVQLTMIGYGIARGERPTPVMWLGLTLAAGGLLVLTIPAVERPDPLGVMLMVVAGIAWAVYTLVGRGTSDPIAANARSFLWSTPLAMLLVALGRAPVHATGRGVVLALVSGAIASGLGYAVWYRVLPRLTVTQAAVAQLSVPVIAAAGAVVTLGESLTTRLVLAGVAVLSGVGLVLSARRSGGPEARAAESPAARRTKG
jgi:drug/metabolite transporter (DMT)-like permease